MVKERMARFAAMANEPWFDRRGINFGRMSWFQAIKGLIVVVSSIGAIIIASYRGTHFVDMVINRFTSVEVQQKTTADNVKTLAAQETATTIFVSDLGNKVDSVSEQIGDIAKKLDALNPVKHAGLIP